MLFLKGPPSHASNLVRGNQVMLELMQQAPGRRVYPQRGNSGATDAENEDRRKNKQET